MVIFLSIDVTIDENYGNLANQRTIAYWMDKLYKRCVVAILAGPPCETFSIARYNQIVNCSVRPVRDVNNPWGHKFLTGRERAQVNM
eukprot:4705291-Karenia_brevis.AAC.1